MDEDEVSVHIGTATNRSNSLLQLPSFSYLLMFINEVVAEAWQKVLEQRQEILGEAKLDKKICRLQKCWKVGNEQNRVAVWPVNTPKYWEGSYDLCRDWQVIITWLATSRFQCACPLILLFWIGRLYTHCVFICRCNVTWNNVIRLTCACRTLTSILNTRTRLYTFLHDWSLWT